MGSQGAIRLQPPTAQAIPCPDTVDHRGSTTSKVSNPYHNAAIVKLVVRKQNTKTLPRYMVKTLASSKHSNTYFQTKNLFYKASLHAAVRRRGKFSRYLNNNYKNKLTLSQNLSKLQPLTSGFSCTTKMTGQGKGAARILTEDPNFVMLDTSSPPQGQKRTGGNRTSSEEKRTKATAEKRGKSIPKEKHQPTPQFWLGFEAMEKLALDEGAPHMIESTPIQKKGRSEKEADELLASVFSDPHVGQTLFPLIRPDDIEGQHFNITQIPFEVETDPDSGLSYDYQVVIYFQKPSKQYIHEEVLTLTQARLRDMKIPLGSKIAEPIAILCRNGSARHWSGTIKLHLKHPKVDGINLLNGTRPFILTLDGNMTVEKICKSYNTVVKNNMLSVKINSLSLLNVTGHSLFEEVVEESFKRGQELEITGVQKNTLEIWALLVAPTPSQAEKIVKFKATFRNGIIAPVIKTEERLTTIQLAKKIA